MLRRLWTISTKVRSQGYSRIDSQSASAQVCGNRDHNLRSGKGCLLILWPWGLGGWLVNGAHGDYAALYSTLVMDLLNCK